MARPAWAARTPRQHMVRFFRKLAFACVMLGDKKGQEEYTRLLDFLLSRSYIVPHFQRIPQDRQHLQFLLALPCDQFRFQARISQDSFARLLELVSSHDVFVPRGRKQQKSVCEQLFSFLVFAACSRIHRSRRWRTHDQRTISVKYRELQYTFFCKCTPSNGGVARSVFPNLSFLNWHP